MTEKQIVYNMLKARFRDSETPTHSEVIKPAELISATAFPNVLSKKDIEEIVEDYEINIGVKAFDPDTLVSINESSEWFEKKKGEHSRSHDYWERYSDYLSQEKDFDEDTIKVLKRSTEEIQGSIQY